MAYGKRSKGGKTKKPTRRSSGKKRTKTLRGKGGSPGKYFQGGGKF